MTEGWNITVGAATPAGRQYLERLLDETLASDACVVIRLHIDTIGSELIGWGDDYGTAHMLEGFEELKEQCEKLLEAVNDVISVAAARMAG